jgi:hypothetical protein
MISVDVSKVIGVRPVRHILLLLALLHVGALTAPEAVSAI